MCIQIMSIAYTVLPNFKILGTVGCSTLKLKKKIFLVPRYQYINNSLPEIYK